MRSTMDIKKIVAAGGGVILDASKYSTLDLKSIAGTAKATVTLKNASEFSTMDLKNIAAAGNGHVVFDFSE